jgi:hypothetical protein
VVGKIRGASLTRPGVLRQQGLANPVLHAAVVFAAAEMALAASEGSGAGRQRRQRRARGQAAKVAGEDRELRRGGRRAGPVD